MTRVLTNARVVRSAVLTANQRYAFLAAFPLLVSIAFQGRRISLANAMWIVPMVYILIFPIFFGFCILAAKQKLARRSELKETFEQLNDREKGRFIGNSVI